MPLDSDDSPTPAGEEEGAAPDGAGLTFDYRKLDAALAAAVSEAPDPVAPDFSVFVHLAHAPSDDERSWLDRVGVPGVGARHRILTATLSSTQVGELSRHSLVRQLRLSQRLDLYRRPSP